LYTLQKNQRQLEKDLQHIHLTFQIDKFHPTIDLLFYISRNRKYKLDK